MKSNTKISAPSFHRSLLRFNRRRRYTEIESTLEDPAKESLGTESERFRAGLPEIQQFLRGKPVDALLYDAAEAREMICASSAAKKVLHIEIIGSASNSGTSDIVSGNRLITSILYGPPDK